MKINITYYRKWFHNSKVKLFSLLSALFLWFFVVTDNNFEHTLSVHLRLSNKPEGWILTHPLPSKVRVRFRGSGKELLTFSHFYRDKRIELDLHQNKKPRKLRINLDMLKGVPTGMGITPLQIVEPESVMVQLDQSASKRVPIYSGINLVPADGFIQVGDIILEPDSIDIMGPKSFVDAISEISTEQKEYRGLLKKIRDKVSLVPPEWETLHYSLNSVRFKADIQRIGERVITDIPVEVTHVPRGVNVTVVPSTLSITLQGGVNVLANTKRGDIKATIDYPSRRDRGRRLKAIINLPENIFFRNVKPQYFELIIER